MISDVPFYAAISGSFAESNPGKCFRGEAANYLYLSIDMLNSQLVIHNKDPILGNLMFEAGVIGMDDEKLNRVQPTSLLEAIQNVLDLLMIAKDESRDVATELTRVSSAVLCGLQLKFCNRCV
ncbi:unnamed protein product [Echinostoma caproni]|uniref:ARM repeat superfamily protein n=1 Tax=Echinostoma caproni TaxID=27848 RepID=A0A183A4B3_9TREM|nr:unnamed protein product [Echinostoma caproni]